MREFRVGTLAVPFWCISLLGPRTACVHELWPQNHPQVGIYNGVGIVVFGARAAEVESVLVAVTNNLVRTRYVRL